MATEPKQNAFVSDLGTHMVRLIEAGDTEAARIAHDAIGKLFGPKSA